ncbi:MAG: MFS transporter [Candidatus Syntrophoarchaeum butanivorans]|uniref:MFS transporter n=2 Tax=Candidatus Syntropharchaeum butanivorans TaxID=1839936 RepID=A0A1F2P4K1_9EURY|nr:MAG: MFS transporter [Candidatus Syntrophoarchaeum butanivorans]
MTGGMNTLLDTLPGILKRLGRFEVKHPWVIILFVLIFTIISLHGIGRIETITSYENMMPSDIPVIQTMHIVQDEYGGAGMIQILLEADDVRDPGVIKAIDTLSQMIEDEKDVTGVSSIVDLVKQDGFIPSSKEAVKKILENLPKGQVERIVSDDFRYTLINIRENHKSDPVSMNDLAERIMRDMETVSFPDGVTLRIAGGVPREHEMSKLRSQDFRKISTFGLLLVLLVVILYFRSVTNGLLALSPVAIAIFWTGGWMGYLGIPFSSAMTGLISMLMGLGVDYGIHIIHRYEEEVEKGLSVEDAVVESVTNIGIGLVIVSLTTIVGFLALTASDLVLMRQMGEALALGIFFCFFAATLMLPPVLVVKDGRRRDDGNRKKNDSIYIGGS